MVERAVVANNGSLAYHYAHAVVNEDAAADSGTRVDFDAGKPAGDMRTETRQPVESLLPDPVREAMHNQRMYAGVGRQYLPAGSGRRVTLENDADIFF